MLNAAGCWNSITKSLWSVLLGTRNSLAKRLSKLHKTQDPSIKPSKILQLNHRGNVLLKYQRHSKHTSAVLSTGICECPLGGAHRASALVAVSTGVLSGCMWATAKPFCQGRFIMFYAKLPWCHKGLRFLHSLIFLCRVKTTSEFIVHSGRFGNDNFWRIVGWCHLTSPDLRTWPSPFLLPTRCPL